MLVHVLQSRYILEFPGQKHQISQIVQQEWFYFKPNITYLNKTQKKVVQSIKNHKLKSIHWVNRSAQSSFFEKDIILTKPFQPTRADISCHSLKNISLCRTFSQWMGFRVSLVFFFLVLWEKWRYKIQVRNAEKKVFLQAKRFFFESRPWRLVKFKIFI